MKTIQAIIIDDMAFARASLRSDIQEFCPEVSIIGEAEGVLSGLKLLKNIQPDLIFLDIHLTDGEGFDILDLASGLQAKVIFTTASDQHAIQAFQFEALDYLLKPVDPVRLQAAVKKYKDLYSKPPTTRSDKKTQQDGRISLHTQDDIKLVAMRDILRLQSDGNYTTVYTTNGEKTMVSKSMKEFEKQLSEFGFVRVHQSHMVSLDKIKSYLKSEGGFLQLIDGTEVPVSVRKKAEIVKLLHDISL